MKIVYFHWAKNNGPSIGRSFAPLIQAMRETYEVEEYYVPYNGSLPWNLLRNILFIRKYSTKHGINHITGDIHYGILGLIGRPSVLTIHDDYAMVTAHRGWLDKVFKYVFWMWLPIKLADKVLCITTETKRKVERWVKSDKLIVLPNHVMDTLFKPCPREINKDSLRFLQIGTHQQKNLETTLHVLAKFNRPYHLRVIKKMTDEQVSLAKQLGINYSNVYNLTDDEIVEEYNKADIILFPSLFEGFGMPPIEAQIVGRAALTTNREPMCSVAGGEQCVALLDNPLDVEEYLMKLYRIIDDDDYRHSLIQHGMKNAMRYSLTIVAETFRRFYNVLKIKDKRIKRGGVI